MNNDANESPKYPATRPEITAQIIALDCQIADLILKCGGSARELDELAGVLDTHLGCCEFERDSLMGIDTNQPAPTLPTLTDLPMSEQTMIFCTALFNAMVLSALQKITRADINLLIAQISEQINIEMAKISDKQITEALTSYLEQYRKYPEQQGFKVQIPNNN